jgi:hypothetical protein
LVDTAKRNTINNIRTYVLLKQYTIKCRIEKEYK